ncbi:MAG: V-type ATPase subunit [Clostridia bacterium]|nr:V-type ATPase subunit [Clostridia bacterium]
MGDVRRFAAVNTKIKAMEGLLLDDGAYQALVTLNEPEEILQYLKKTSGYSSIVELSGNEIDIDGEERRLRGDLIEKYERLGHYFADHYKKFYKTMFMRFEIEDIKLFLRTFLRKEDVGFLKEHLFQTRYHQLDLEQLTKANSIESFVESLKGTPYYNLIKYYLEEDPEKMMFYMEMSLDHYYFNTLHKQLSEFSNEDKKSLLAALGQNVDLQNLQWIYRGLKYYDLSSEELLNYTLHVGYYLKYKDLKELCYTRDIDQLVARIQNTKYGFLFKGDKHNEIFFELNMERYLLKLMTELKRKHPMTFMDTIVYMHRKEYEIRDIFTLLEAKRYHAPIEDVKRFLVHIVV